MVCRCPLEPQSGKEADGIRAWGAFVDNFEEGSNVQLLYSLEGKVDQFTNVFSEGFLINLDSSHGLGEDIVWNCFCLDQRNRGETEHDATATYTDRFLSHNSIYVDGPMPG